MTPGLRQILFGRRVFSPSDIASLTLWLKADALSLNDADPVASWIDSSGLGNHAAQATEAKKPTYKVNIVNGKPVVRFDGTNDTLETAGVLLSRTVFIIASHADGATFTAFRRVLTAGSDQPWTLYGDSGTSDYSSGGTTTNIWINGSLSVSALPLASPKVISFIANAQANQIIRVGSFFADVQFLAGDIAEAIIYSGSLSTTDRRSVEKYLGAKYGITVA